jgi:hypothetical protein
VESLRHQCRSAHCGAQVTSATIDAPDHCVKSLVEVWSVMQRVVRGQEPRRIGLFRIVQTRPR